jgi:RPE1 domain-containing protein
MKPVALIERMIQNSSRPNDVVLDPFGGSGSTLIAAENLGRKARLIELDPKYVDVIVKRWERHTGLSSKPSESELLEGDTEHRSAAYSGVREHSSTGSTHQEADCEELRRKSTGGEAARWES